MSWWVYLDGKWGPVEIPQHEQGGTYLLGGTSRAELNVTYNYGDRYREVLSELEGSGALNKMLDGKLASETIPMLTQCVENLGTERSDDYWEPTSGNAGAALAILLHWAQIHPNATWRVS